MCGAKLMSAMLSGESTEQLGFGPAPGSESQRPYVPTYLVQSILVTFFCCLPFGIPAIVYAAQVDDRLRRGDVAGAIKASNSAKTWCWVSFGIGFVTSVGGFLVGFLAEMARIR
jgi:hypothetical protein